MIVQSGIYSPRIALTDRLNQFPIRINERWRLIDEPRHWIWQILKGNPTQKSTDWKSQSYCVTRPGLMLCLREDCGPVDETVMAFVANLPERHSQPMG